MPLFNDVRPLAGHRGMTVGIKESRFATRAWVDLRERVRCPTIFSKSTIRHLMTGAGIMTNRWWLEMLESLFALADYSISLSALTLGGGDLH